MWNRLKISCKSVDYSWVVILLNTLSKITQCIESFQVVNIDALLINTIQHNL